MLSGAALDAVLAKPPSRPYRGILWRATLTSYVTDPLGKGRPIARNRFNVADGARILYCALEQVTCLAEIQAAAWPVQATSLIPVAVNLSSVLNLTDHRVLAALDTNADEVSFNFRSLAPGSAPTASQELGEAAARLGTIDGLVWHSCAVPGGLGPLDLAIIEAGVVALRSSVQADDPMGRLTHRLP